MSQGLSKGEKPAWNTPAKRAGGDTMDRVADSARAARVKTKKAEARRRPAGRPR